MACAMCRLRCTMRTKGAVLYSPSVRQFAVGLGLVAVSAVRPSVAPERVLGFCPSTARPVLSYDCSVSGWKVSLVYGAVKREWRKSDDKLCLLVYDRHTCKVILWIWTITSVARLCYTNNLLKRKYSHRSASHHMSCPLITNHK